MGGSPTPQDPPTPVRWRSSRGSGRAAGKGRVAGRDELEGGEVTPPPPLQGAQPTPSTVPLTPSASFNDICNRQ